MAAGGWCDKDGFPVIVWSTGDSEADQIQIGQAHVWAEKRMQDSTDLVLRMSREQAYRLIRELLAQAEGADPESEEDVMVQLYTDGIWYFHAPDENRTVLSVTEYTELLAMLAVLEWVHETDSARAAQLKEDSEASAWLRSQVWEGDWSDEEKEWGHEE